MRKELRSVLAAVMLAVSAPAEDAGAQMLLEYGVRIDCGKHAGGTGAWEKDLPKGEKVIIGSQPVVSEGDGVANFEALGRGVMIGAKAEVKMPLAQMVVKADVKEIVFNDRAEIYNVKIEEGEHMRDGTTGTRITVKASCDSGW